jgi:hypothetical protein
MSSPWDPAITQAMQRHGGSNRSIPRTQPKPMPKESSDSIAAPQGQDQVHGQAQDQFDPSGKPKAPAAA